MKVKIKQGEIKIKLSKKQMKKLNGNKENLLVQKIKIEENSLDPVILGTVTGLREITINELNIFDIFYIYFPKYEMVKKYMCVPYAGGKKAYYSYPEGIVITHTIPKDDLMYARNDKNNLILDKLKIYVH